MRFQRIGLSALVTFLATILNVELRLPILDWQLIQNSQVLAQTPEARKAEADQLLQQGNQQYRISQFEAALQSWQQALIIYREIKDRKGEGQSLGSLGIAYDSLGDYTKAIEYHQQSLAIARDIKDYLGGGRTLGDMGTAYHSLGNYARAIEYYHVSLKIAQEIKDRLGMGRTLSNLGNVYYSLGEYAKAIEYHQQSLAIAQEIKDRLGKGQTLSSLGNVYYSLGEYAKAIEYHQQSLAIAKKIHNFNLEVTALNKLGAALRKSGNLVEAERILRTVIEKYEILREQFTADDHPLKVSVFEQQAYASRRLQQILIARDQPTAALEVSENGRSRVFVELLNKNYSSTLIQYNDPINFVIVDPPTLQVIQQIAKQQNATLVEYSITYDDFKIRGKEEVHESELYIWVISPTGEVTFRKADLKPLWQQQNTTIAQLVTTSRESIGVRNRSELAKVVVELSPQAQQRRVAQQRQKLQQLHQLLIEPIANLLPTDPQARVIFIPHGELFLVPFPALVDASGQYLIEKHTLLTAPSIEVLNSTRQQRQLLKSAVRHPAPSDVLIVGNPSMPKVWNPNSGKPEQLPYLEGAEKEAQSIADFFHVPALLDEQATERTIKQRILNARIVHLATHGLLDYGNPQDTGTRDFPGAIALAPGDGEDGLLTSAEIQQMKLKAELVVLSACDTGQGRLTGDGVIGLSRSLISAGVPSVIVSLWAVDDAATTELMQEFYKQWQQNPDKAQALRQAMLITMKNHPDPRLWAAFTLIGEAE